MKRIDLMKVGDEDGDDDIICGLIMFNGKLQWAEGSRRAAESTLRDFVIGPGPRRVTSNEDPEIFMQLLPASLRNGYVYWTEPYDDDDALYDMTTGVFIGDIDNPPLPTNEQLDAIEGLATPNAETISLSRIQAKLTTLPNDCGDSGKKA